MKKLEFIMDICIKYSNTIIFNTNKTINVSDGFRYSKGQVLQLLSTTYMEDFNSGQKECYNHDYNQ